MATITREKAMDLAVKYLSFKSRTTSEMVDYLQRKNVEAEMINQVIEKLAEYRYIDDVVYLKNYVENNRHLNCYGSRRMMQDLKKRGIDDELLATLEDLFPKQEEYQYCEAIAKKNLRALSGQSTAQKQKKLYDKLGRMGYANEMILEIIRALISAEEPMALDEEEIAVAENKLRSKLNRDYEKYARTHGNKGAQGKELKFRIKKSLMGRGYPYEMINEKLEQMSEESTEN